MIGLGIARDHRTRISLALLLALLTVLSVLSPIPFNHSVARALTSVVVDSNDCAGTNFCTVQEAINSFSTPAGDEVRIEVRTGAALGIYPQFVSIPTGRFDQGLTIVGVESGVILQAVSSDPTVLVQSGNVVTIQDLALEQTTDQRVIENYGDLTLSNVDVTGGNFGGDGGGIFNSGVLAVQAGSLITGNTAGLFGLGLVDQQNETVSGTTGSAASLLQGFTPTDDLLKRVELEFRADGGYAGSTQTIRVYPVVGGAPDLTSPLGEVQRSVPSSEIAGGASAFIPFDFDPPLTLNPYEEYAIEWGGGSVSWYFSSTTFPPANPYAGGSSWVNGAGGITETPDRDYHFRTYGATLDVPGNGGGMFNDGGEVFLDNSTVTGNLSLSSGGAIYSNTTAELTLTATSVDDNHAFEDGGGIFSSGYAGITGGSISDNIAEGRGGGVYVAEESSTQLIVDGTSFTGNTARYGGGAIFNDGGVVSMSNAAVGPDNISTDGHGGALYSYGGSVNLTDTNIDGNDAFGNGGGVYLSGAHPDYDGTVTMVGGSLVGNEAFEYEGEGTEPAFGGGLANYYGTAVLSQVTVSGNTVYGYGGGISSGYNATTEVFESEVTGNTAFTADSYDPAGSGGGIFAYGQLSVESSTLSVNVADADGGGIGICDSDPVTIVNSTISGNQATTGGGISNDACGSGSLMDTRVNNTTVTANTAFDSGGGIENTSAPLRLDNSIVAGNLLDDGVNTSPEDCVGTAASGISIYNVLGVAGCGLVDGTNGNQAGSPASPLDPLLGPLASNGGPTNTHELLAGSPAIDAGDPGGTIDPTPSSCELLDQRGIARPQGDYCDVGAFESEATIVPPSVDEIYLDVYTDSEGPTEPGVVDVGITEIPIERITGTDNILGSTPLSSIPLSSIPLSSIDLAASPLSSIPLSSIPLSSIPLSSIPLSSIPLSSIPLSSIGGWDAILEGTIYADEPAQNVTLDQVLALDPAPAGLAALEIGDIQIQGSPLSSISLPSLALGSATLGDLGEPGLCDDVPTEFNCTQNSTVLGLEVQGAPLSSIPLSSIPLSSIDLAATPLSSIPLSSIPLSSIPLSSIPLSSIPLSSIDLLGAPLSSIPLSSIPLSSIPLSSIDIAGSPLSSIPLSSITIGTDPFCDFVDGLTGGAVPCNATDTLGDYQAAVDAALDVGTITANPLSSIDLEELPLSSIPLSSIPLSSIPLSSIDMADIASSPLSSIPLSSIDVGGDFCAFIASDGTDWCLDLGISGTDTLGDLITALLGSSSSIADTPLSSIPLSSIPLSSIPLSSIPLSSIEIAGVPLSSIPLSSIPLSSIDLLVDCSNTAVDCENDTLGDAEAANAFVSGVTYGDLVNALSLEFLYGAGTLNDSNDYGELALGQLLMALLLRSDFPWETVPLDQIGAQEFSADHLVTYDLYFQLGGSGPAVSAEAVVTIPEEFLYVNGSSHLYSYPDEQSLEDPAITEEEDGSTTLVWAFDVSPGSDYSLTLDVVPSLSLGTYTAFADVTVDTSTGSAEVDVTVVEEWRGGEGPPLAESDILYLGHITDAEDVDYWEVEAPPAGYRVAVFLSNLSEDADLVMYRPVGALPDSPVTPRSAPLSSIPFEDDGVDFGGNTTEEPETLEDVPLLDPSGDVVTSTSTNRDSSSESVSTLATGDDSAFTIQVSGYNGASSDDPYVLRVKTVPEVPTPFCDARVFPYTVTGSAPGVPTLPANLNSLFVVNWERLAATEGEAQANLILDKLTAPGTGLIHQSALGVVGGVLLVDGVDYTAWDTNPCDVDAANEIVGDITQLISGIQLSHPSLRYITIVGGDEVIPMGRKPDLTTVANESTYLEFFDNNALYGSFVTKHYLSDDSYGDLDPVPWLDRYLNVPDLALGRLVEDAGDIVLAIDKFIQYGGALDPTTADALTAGYDFLADGSVEVDNALTANFSSSDSLINETWDRDDLNSALRLGTPNQIEIASLNAHYDHNRALPALGNATGDESNLFTVADIAGFALDRSLYFTMGCHAGLSVADIAVGVFNDNDSDWAQTYASQGALYAGNTGYGYGDTVAVALSERLMAQFAGRLDGSMTVGQAMIFAKQQYFGDLGLYGVYDEKALQEATFYGLPMYTIGTGTPVQPAPVTTAEDPATGLQSASVSFSPNITQLSTPIGEFFSADGEAQFVHFRPLQPIVRTDVTPADGTLLARGALITGLSTTDVSNVDIAYARPIIDLSALEPEVESDEMVFPTTFAAVSFFNAPPSSAAGPPVEQRQQLNIIAGQFTSPADGSTLGTQRLFTNFDATVYYFDANASGDDFSKPSFNQIQAALVGGQASFIVDVQDDSTVARVIALYRQSTSGGQSTWVSVDLVQGSPWTGGGPIDPSALVDGKLDYMIQAVDSSGNVAVSTFKGLFHKAQELPPPPAGGGEHNVVITGTLGNNGWYTSPVTISVTGDPAVTIDGVPTGGGSPYTISEDGPHRVTVGDDIFGILIDQTAPAIAINVPAADAEYEVGDYHVADYACLDAGSGIVSCDGPIADGAVIETSTLGEYDFTVTAADHAGYSASLTHSFGVYGIDGPKDPVPVGTQVDFTALVPVAPGSATWDWSDGTAPEAGATTGKEVIGSHIYTDPGVYRVSLEAGAYEYFFEYVVVYDPSGGFVTGGGWFNSPSGAFTPDNLSDPDVIGKASFGFVSKYKKGASVPTGNTTFKFQAGGLNFQSSSYDWMVISGARARYKGSGSVDGYGGLFKFQVTALDADVNSNDSHTEDAFRIKIWQEFDPLTGDPFLVPFVLYDNGLGADDGTGSGGTTPLGGGSIVIHEPPKGKK